MVRIALIAMVVAAGSAATTKPSSGLELFRKKGRDSLSCSRCHSPDGIEISAFGFTKKDIARRALGHLGKADAEKLAEFLKNSQFARTNLKPDSERPLQPGRLLLKGNSAVERDAAFGRELTKLVPELTGAPVRTLTEALRARDRLLALDPRATPIGIPFNRLSEDGFHGKQHATVADWIPDVGLNMSPAYMAQEDQYLQHPTLDNLNSLEKSAWLMIPDNMLQQLAIAKFRALLLLQHAIRIGGPKAARLDRINLIGPGNPFWEVAEVARNNYTGDPGRFSMPKSIQEKKKGVPSSEQMHELRLPWYWTGWALDPSLTHLGRGISGTVRRADYFTRLLWDDGPYPLHMAFMLSKKLVEDGFGVDLPKSPVPQHYEIQFSNFLMEAHLSTPNPSWAPIRLQVNRVAGNAFRISLFLLEHDIDTTHACVRPESQLGEISAMRLFFQSGAGDAHDLALCDRVTSKLKVAHSDDSN